MDILMPSAQLQSISVCSKPTASFQQTALFADAMHAQYTTRVTINRSKSSPKTSLLSKLALAFQTPACNRTPAVGLQQSRPQHCGSLLSPASQQPHHSLACGRHHLPQPLKLPTLHLLHLQLQRPPCHEAEGSQSPSSSTRRAQVPPYTADPLQPRQRGAERGPHVRLDAAALLVSLSQVQRTDTSTQRAVQCLDVDTADFCKDQLHSQR
mmetsp:Transcript_3142/g.7859  ORF Transcript_3142/g.7859 Transcript_3142/m.7859 type:complete len:210 (-) Transcript_3142:679-1308(-)